MASIVQIPTRTIFDRLVRLFSFSFFFFSIQIFGSFLGTNIFSFYFGFALGTLQHRSDAQSKNYPISFLRLRLEFSTPHQILKITPFNLNHIAIAETFSSMSPFSRIFKLACLLLFVASPGNASEIEFMRRTYVSPPTLIEHSTFTCVQDFTS